MLNTSGQATVEYLIVGLILIVMISALSLLTQTLQDGLFVTHAAQSASHAITGNTAGTVGDVLLY
jgi:Flp pilus assembly pilin Flp